MELKTYRARSLQEALLLVRQELGPEAAVLHTREVGGGLWSWFSPRQFEVTASPDVRVPSRFRASMPDPPPVDRPREDRIPPADGEDYRRKFREDLKGYALGSAMDEQWTLPGSGKHGPRPEGGNEEAAEATAFSGGAGPTRRASRGFCDLFHRLLADLLDAGVDEEIAYQLLEQQRSTTGVEDRLDQAVLRDRLRQQLEEELLCSGPIQVTPGQRRLVALVGPTGVGKTTTIAKLAANFHLRERHGVGLITVDTYRIAAVDQLRTYADIIDLPMEVVSTPREMREAVARLQHLDLVLMDTAGRSPRDEVRIQELKSLLAVAHPDEVHLVLSGVASPTSWQKAAEQFQQVGATSLILTKLDEITGMGSLLPLLRRCRLPLSYLTNGQNVPDDIAPAERRALARLLLGIQESSLSPLSRAGDIRGLPGNAP